MPLIRPFALGLGVTLAGTSSYLLAPTLLRYRDSFLRQSPYLLRCDTSTSGSSFASTPFGTPITSNNTTLAGSSSSSRNKNHAFSNPNRYRQISYGSFLGIFAGAAVGFFSKFILFLAAVTVIGVNYLERQGVHVVPYGQIKAALGQINYQKFVAQDWAFKASFASAFVMTMFGKRVWILLQ